MPSEIYRMRQALLPPTGRTFLFLDKHDGTFQNVSTLVGQAIQVPQVSRGVAFGDLFNDGRIDIVVENLQRQSMILRPQDGPQNHWISFALEGPRAIVSP
jgi:enediyne biosynthesis protein E4